MSYTVLKHLKHTGIPLFNKIRSSKKITTKFSSVLCLKKVHFMLSLDFTAV